MDLTRRKLLGGMGLGALGLGAGNVLARDHPAYTHYTYASPGDLDDRRLRVAWYERYNGRYQENQAGAANATLDESLDPDGLTAYIRDATFVTDSTGPVVAVGNVLPGDEGTLVVGLDVVEDGDVVAEPLDVWLHATVTADEENGRVGPERRDGDTTDDDGELDDEVTVELWRDGSPLGSCNGRTEFDEALEGPIVPRAPIREALGPTTPVGSASGTRVFSGLSPGATRCLALDWEFPVETATNRAQGDSVSFAVTVAGVPVDAASPFEQTTEGQS